MFDPEPKSWRCPSSLSTHWCVIWNLNLLTSYCYKCTLYIRFIISIISIILVRYTVTLCEKNFKPSPPQIKTSPHAYEWEAQIIPQQLTPVTWAAAGWSAPPTTNLTLLTSDMHTEDFYIYIYVSNDWCNKRWKKNWKKQRWKLIIQ